MQHSSLSRLVNHELYTVRYNKNVPETVLVAHNGVVYDFPLLLTEIEQIPNCLSTQQFVTKNIHFADTLSHLRQVESGQSLLFIDEVGIMRFGMENLYGHIFKDKTYSGIINSRIQWAHSTIILHV